MFILAKVLKGKDSNPKQNHMRFVYLSSGFGGMLLGGGVCTYLAQLYTKQELSTWVNNWDQKQYLSEVEEKEKRGSRFIYFVRHGQYQVQEEDPEKQVLTLKGQLQGQSTAKKLKNIKFDKICTSTMIRAQQTANIINIKKQEIEIDHLLQEGYPCFASPDFGKVTKHNQEKVWLDDDQNENMEKAFTKYFKRSENTEDTNELFVCHANLIRFFVCKLLQFPTEAWLRLSIDHCGITVIQISNDGNVKLLRLGDSGHLPKELVTV